MGEREKTNREDMNKLLSQIMVDCDDPYEIWNGNIARSVLTEEYLDFILSLANWKISLTLTFRENKTHDVALSYWRRLVRYLNIDIYGKNYTRKVKHSYFSYALGIEKQIRDVIHFHVIIDKPVNFTKIHKLWNDWAGFAWTDIIRNREDCVRYIAKYNLKGGDIELYKATKDFIPTNLPQWWNAGDNIFGVQPTLDFALT